MVQHYKPTYEFGPFLLDANERLLLKGGQPIALAPKAFDTLLVLVQNSGHALEKDELMKAVWPDSFVEEVNLAHNISVLRKALGQDEGGIRFIETLPRRGYRFVAAVRQISGQPSALLVHEHQSIVIEQEEDVSATSDVARPGKSRIDMRVGIVSLLATIALLGMVALYLLNAGTTKEPTVQPEIHSIAVLPFKPLIADDGDEALEMGLADSLITRLSSVRRLAIRPLGSVRRFAGPEQDSIGAGRELKVDAVIEGSFHKSGERIRVTVRLVRVADGAGLYSDKTDHPSSDLLAVQDRFTEMIARALVPALTGEERQRLARHSTDNPKAYELYLTGRYFWNKRNDEAIKKSFEYFEQAIKLDPNFGLAYAGLADSHVALGVSLPSTEEFIKLKEAAEKAIALDGSIAEPHAALGVYLDRIDFDWQAAEREFKRAIELDPNYATAHQWYAIYLEFVGRLEDAVAEDKRALELDPTSLVINTSLAERLLHAARNDEAIEQSMKTLELYPDSTSPRGLIAQAHIQMGLLERAIGEYEKILAQDDPGPAVLAALGHAYAIAGQKERARKITRQLEAMSKSQHVSVHFLALVYASLGETDKLFGALFRAIQQKDPTLVAVLPDRRLDPIRKDPRYQEFLRRIRLA